MPATAQPRPTGGETAADAGEPVATLALSGISRSYGRRQILHDVDLVVPHGESVLITGANGAGKTTLLRVAAGVITAHGGSVSLFGLDPEVHRAQCQRRLGFMPAGDRSIYARLTVRRNLEFWARIAFVPRAERRATVDRALGRFELEELATRRADRLSMGQRQRVRLAMTFLHDPELVMLDEPDSSLDEHGLTLLRAAVEATLEGGGSTLWCAPTGSRDVLPADRSCVIAGGTLEVAR
jgi:ABC-2 type transport system ATP-binding protein